MSKMTSKEITGVLEAGRAAMRRFGQRLEDEEATRQYDAAFNAELKRLGFVRLTDQFHADEPLAYLVKCPDSCATCEYRVFASESDARWRAESNEETADDPVDWDVFPLYAAEPIERRKTS